MKPTDYLPLLKRVDHAIDEAIVILDVLMADAVRVEESLDVSLRVVLSEVRVLHDVLPRMAKDGVIDIQRCADGPSSVPCRRLDIQLFERSLPEDPTVRHAVQCDTAGHAEAGQARLGIQGPGHGEERFLGHELDASGDIGIMLVLSTEFCVIRGPLTKVRRVS